jgi:hypothetical protein
MADFIPSKPPEDNPFAAPEVAVRRQVGLPDGDIGEAELIRRKYLNHEASVRGLGALMIFSGVCCVIGGIVALVFVIGGVPVTIPALQGIATSVLAGYGIYFLASGVISFAVGVGLRRLSNRARIAMAVLIGLNIAISLYSMTQVGIQNPVQVNANRVNVSFTWLFYAYFLYLMLSAKGKFVTSHEYAAIRAQTPHIKYRMSCILKWLLIVLLVFFGVMIVMGLIVAVTGGPPRQR